MRLSEFAGLLEQEFGGPYGRRVASSHVIHALGDRTADQAIEDGLPVRRAWEALCEDLQIPPERRFLADQRRR